MTSKYGIWIGWHTHDASTYGKMSKAIQLFGKDETAE